MRRRLPKGIGNFFAAKPFRGRCDFRSGGKFVINEGFGYRERCAIWKRGRCGVITINRLISIGRFCTRLGDLQG